MDPWASENLETAAGAAYETMEQVARTLNNEAGDSLSQIFVAFPPSS